jgi:hypothetical protein
MYNELSSFINFFSLLKKLPHAVKLFMLTTGILITPFFTQAQSQDSLAIKAAAFTADKFAERRPFSVDYKRYANYNFSSAFNGLDLPDGRVTNWSQVTASANIPFFQNRSWLLTGSAFYRFVATEYSYAASPSAALQSTTKDFHYHTEGLNATYFSKLLGKTAVFTAGVNVDGSEEAFERVRGLFTASIVLKADSRTKMNVGLLYNTDPSTLIRIAPTFLYEHQFNNKWMADLFLPRYAFIRKKFSENNRLSAGWELDAQTTFFLYDVDATGTVYQYRQVDVNAGLVYEHLLPGNIILSFKGGFRINPYSRTFEKDRSFTDYVWNGRADPTPYLNLGFSFNPFVKRKK